MQWINTAITFWRREQEIYSILATIWTVWSFGPHCSRCSRVSYHRVSFTISKLFYFCSNNVNHNININYRPPTIFIAQLQRPQRWILLIPGSNPGARREIFEYLGSAVQHYEKIKNDKDWRPYSTTDLKDNNVWLIIKFFSLHITLKLVKNIWPLINMVNWHFSVLQ